MAGRRSVKRMDVRHSAMKALAAAAAAAVPCGAIAAGPAAIVEDVDASLAGVAFMEYLEAGRVLQLGANGMVAIGYLRSCLRETITGGTVTVGSEQSVVTGGSVVRERVECDGGALELTTEQAGKSAVLVLRKLPGSAAGAMPQPTLTIYGASPVIKLTGGGAAVEIERLDRPRDTLKIAVAGGLADLAATGQSLKPGGLYRARAGEAEIVFKVDAFARPGKGPIIGRLIAF